MAESKVRVIIGAETKDIESKLARVKGKLGDFSSTATATAAAAATVVAAAFTAIGVAAITAAGNVEKMQVGMQSLLGGSEQAAMAMDSLNQFAASTPFQLEQIVSAFRQLVASGSSVEEAKRQLQFLGDIAAASGNEINEIAAIFAKVNAKGKVELENLNQLAERGIPIFEALAAATGKPADALGAGAVSVEQFNAVLQQFATNGEFADGAMINLSGTLSGTLSTASDNVSLAMASIGEAMLPMAKALATAVIHISEFVQSSPLVQGLAVAFITLGTALAGATAATLAWSTAATVGMVPATFSATAAVRAFTAAIYANPILAAAALVVAGILSIATALGALDSQQGDNNETASEAARRAELQEKANARQLAGYRTLIKELEKGGLTAEQVNDKLEKLKNGHSAFADELEDGTAAIKELWGAYDRAAVDMGRRTLFEKALGETDDIQGELMGVAAQLENAKVSLEQVGRGDFKFTEFITRAADGAFILNERGKRLANSYTPSLKAVGGELLKIAELMEMDRQLGIDLDEAQAEVKKYPDLLAEMDASADRERLEALKKFSEKRRQANLDAEGKELAALNSAYAEQITAYEGNEVVIDSLIAMRAEERLRIRNKYRAKEEAARERHSDAVLKQVQKEEKLAEELYQAGMDARGREMRAVETDLNRRLEAAGTNAELRLQAEQQFHTDKAALEAKWAKEDKQNLEDLNNEIYVSSLGRQNKEAARMAAERLGIDAWEQKNLETFKNNEAKKTEIAAEAAARRAAIRTDEELKAERAAEQVSQLLQQAMQDAAVGLGQAIGDAMSGTETDFSWLGALGDMLVSLGKIAIAAGVTMKAIKETLFKNPLLAIAGGIAAVAIGTWAKNEAQAAAEGGNTTGGGPAIPAFAEGGAVLGPTLALVGEKPGSRGEAIIPFEKLGQFADMMGINNGATNVVVTGQLKGRDIQLSSIRGGRQRSRRS